MGSRNSDAKIWASSQTRKLNSTLSKHAHKSQKGFIGGQDFIENVVDLDLLARAFSYGFQRRDSRDLFRAIMDFLDVKAAFPSLAWEYLWAILEALGVPIGFRSFFQALYVGVRAVVRFRGSIIDFGFIDNGVNQGCPASAFLFALAINPVLEQLALLIESPNYGKLGACADDIGFVVRDLSVLDPIHDLFRRLRTITGLVLGAAKCVIVPG